MKVAKAQTKKSQPTANTLKRMGVLVAGLWLVACGGNQNIPEHKKVHRAPASNSETGVIVSGLSEDKMADLVSEHAELKVRVINSKHGLYEVFGLEAQALKNEINDPEVIVEKNKFVKLNTLEDTPAVPEATPIPTPKHPLARIIEQNQGVKLEGELLAFVSNCKYVAEKLPVIQVESNQGRDKANASIFFEIDQELELKAEKSIAVGEGNALQFMWIVTGPEDSALIPLGALKSKINYKGDTTGMYIYSLVAKDSANICQLDMNPFYVTANYKYKPENAFPDSFADTISTATFWHLFHVGARVVANLASGTGLTVGVIDSGVDYNHPALSSNIQVNSGEIADNGLDDDNNGFIDDVAGYDFGQDDSSPFDDFGHGTHVAGIAASNIIGAAQKAKILPTKFGAGLGFDIASVVGAITYSVDQGAKVLNMSFGWEEDYEVMRAVMNYAEQKDVLVVAASGNDAANNDTRTSFPCNYKNKNIISVAASDENNALTFYSNYGQSVHLAAPGGTREKMIMSAYRKNPLQSQFTGMIGTSMASPLVAGVAAQVWSANPSLTAEQVRNILVDSGSESEALKGKIASGKVLNAVAALNKALETRPESSPRP